ncbi:Acyl-CoA dehydrogenase-related isoform 1 [Hibiscus syriacus]|uniref:Pectinesterase n=1 Tax=Hibiscus syriacus TaxID=106335 RepID=A0A6A2XJX4_HIBSY|nr:pectinesterase-like [Hibiscus syriacus]KAE8658779.1 Acyl-CoA dehydrogenase-related isoform 1 [Hibiscus syriacus]
MVNNVLFIIVLLVAVVASALTVYFAIGLQEAKKLKDETEEREEKMTNSKKAIRSICKPTKFKEACEESMVNSNTTDPKALIMAEFKATVAEIKNVMVNSKTVQDLQKDEKTKAAFGVCQELFDWAVVDLERSFDKLGEQDMTKIGDVLLTLQVWLSGALTSQETCVDSYAEMDSHAAKKMQEIIAKSQELTKNGLNILNGLPSILKEFNIDDIDISSAFNRKLLSGDFPEWMSYGDRKLLQATPAEITPNVVVAKDGTGKFDTIAKALAEVPKKNTERFVIHIKAGVYEERIDIPKTVGHVMFIGDGPTKTVITGSVSVEKTLPKPSTFRTATVAVAGLNFIAKDIAFENSIGPVGHQAVAFRGSGDMAAFYNCHFNGYQDTLYAHEDRQFYRDCVITGTIDFIFGDARAVFQNCQLIVRKPLDNQNCVIVAEGKESLESKGGFVFQNCTFSGDKDYLPVKDKNKSYLNRPWRHLATVIIMQSQIDDIIQPEGYIPMNGNDGLATSYYVEFGNRGPGAKTDGRVKWEGIKTLDATEIKKFAPGVYLDSDDWIPETGVPIITDMIPGL